MKLRLAKLTPQEAKAWEFAFAYYVTNKKKRDTPAGRLAWRDLQAEFPRLKKYGGAK